MKEYIEKVQKGQDLTGEEANSVMKMMMSGNATEEDVKNFLIALHEKGETAEEIAGFAIVTRALGEKITPVVKGRILDTCGTGGDMSGTFNISTSAAFVISASGIPVAKHGNRAITSKCGSADLLSALGIKIDMEPENVKECIEKIGIGFMFAPRFHRAFKNVANVRKILAQEDKKTVFNILGPLVNPASAQIQLLGVYDPDATKKIAEVLKILGLKRAMVIHGGNDESPEKGIDEVSLSGKTTVSELTEDGNINSYQIEPENLGLKRVQMASLKGGSAQENAVVLKNILSGRERGPLSDIVIINAGCAIYLADLAKDLKGGIEIARTQIQNGGALRKLEELVSFSSSIHP